MDSGQNRVFESNCSEIKWEPGRAMIPSPGQTPGYYANSEYLAWFKLGVIKEIASTQDLRKYSYVRIDEFFTTNKSNYDQFYDKQVYSPEELQQQNRTIWFVRKYRASDPNHEIRLLDANRITPSNFPGVLVTKQDRFVWLWDVHFGKQGFPLQSNEAQNDLCTALEDALKQEAPLAGLLISET